MLIQTHILSYHVFVQGIFGVGSVYSRGIKVCFPKEEEGGVEIWVTCLRREAIVVLVLWVWVTMMVGASMFGLVRVALD